MSNQVASPQTVLKMLSTTMSIPRNGSQERVGSFYDKIEEIGMYCNEIVQCTKCSEQIILENTPEEVLDEHIIEAVLPIENLNMLRDNNKNTRNLIEKIIISIQDITDRCSPTNIEKEQQLLKEAREKLQETQNEIHQIIECKAIEAKHQERNVKNILKTIAVTHNKGVENIYKSMQDIETQVSKTTATTNKLKDTLDQLDLEFTTEINDFKYQLPIPGHSRANTVIIKDNDPDEKQEASEILEPTNEEEKNILKMFEIGGVREENPNEKSAEWDDNLENNSIESTGLKKYMEEKEKFYNDPKLNSSKKNLFKQLIEIDYKRRPHNGEGTHSTIHAFDNNTLSLTKNSLANKTIKEVTQNGVAAVSPVDKANEGHTLEELLDQESEIQASNSCNKENTLPNSNEKDYPKLSIDCPLQQKEGPIKVMDNALRSSNSKSSFNLQLPAGSSILNDNEELISEKSISINKEGDLRLAPIKESDNEMSNMESESVKNSVKLSHINKSFSLKDETKFTNEQRQDTLCLEANLTIAQEEPHSQMHIVRKVSTIDIPLQITDPKVMPDIGTMSCKSGLSTYNNDKSLCKAKLSMPPRHTSKVRLDQSAIHKNKNQTVRNNTINGMMDGENSLQFIQLNTKQLDCGFTKNVGLIFLSSQMTNLRSTVESISKKSGFINLDKTKNVVTMKCKNIPKLSKLSIKLCDDQSYVNSCSLSRKLKQKIASYKLSSRESNNGNMSVIESSKPLFKKEKLKKNRKEFTGVDRVNQSIN